MHPADVALALPDIAPARHGAADHPSHGRIVRIEHLDTRRRVAPGEGQSMKVVRRHCGSDLKGRGASGAAISAPESIIRRARSASKDRCRVEIIWRARTNSTPDARSRSQEKPPAISGHWAIRTENGARPLRSCLLDPAATAGRIDLGSPTYDLPSSAPAPRRGQALLPRLLVETTSRPAPSGSAFARTPLYP